MANKKNNISDKEVKNASGGRTKYYEDVKQWGIIDNDEPDDDIYLSLRDNQKAADELDRWYHAGKRTGYKKGKEEGYGAGYSDGLNLGFTLKNKDNNG